MAKNVSAQFWESTLCDSLLLIMQSLHFLLLFRVNKKEVCSLLLSLHKQRKSEKNLF